MADLQFCSAQNFYKFLPTRTINFSNAPEDLLANTNKEIAKEAKKIVARKQGVVFPVSEPDPLTNTWLLLENLNVLLALAPKIKPTALSTNKDCYRYAKAFQLLAEDRLKEWDTGQLIHGYLAEIKGSPLPATALSSVSSCTLSCSGFTPISENDPDPEGNNLPYIETIERFILRETAYTRIFLSRRGLKQSSYTEDQSTLVDSFVSNFVRAYVLAIRSIVQDGFNAAIDSEIADLIKTGQDEIKKLRQGRYDQDLLDQL